MSILKYVLTVAGIISLLSIAYYWIYNNGASSRDAEWMNRITTAEVRRDTVTKYDTLPPVQVKVYVRGARTAESNKQVDSIVTALTDESDSLKRIISELLQPVAGVCERDSMNFVAIGYYPIERQFVCDFPSLVESLRTITNTQTVIIQESRPWWELPAAIIGAGATGWLLHEAIK